VKKGELQERVQWIVRASGPCSTADVCTELRHSHEISMNAVQTVLNRLVEQGLLTRDGTRRHYRYEAKPTEEAVKQNAARAARDLLSRSGELGLAHFIDTMDELQPDAVGKLERLLAERRAKREGS